MSHLRENLGLPGKKLIGERLRALAARPNKRPVFVFGNQKSGTTAIAALLAAATGRRATLDFMQRQRAPSSAACCGGKPIWARL